MTDKPRYSKVNNLSKSELIHTSFRKESSNISLVISVKENLPHLQHRLDQILLIVNYTKTYNKQNLEGQSRADDCNTILQSQLN